MAYVYTASKTVHRTDWKIVEFAVDGVANIRWTPSSFDNLTLPREQKDVVHALCKSHLARDRDRDHSFDDFIIGKGRGLVILLQ